MYVLDNVEFAYSTLPIPFDNQLSQLANFELSWCRHICLMYWSLWFVFVQFSPKLIFTCAPNTLAEVNSFLVSRHTQPIEKYRFQCTMFNRKGLLPKNQMINRHRGRRVVLTNTHTSTTFHCQPITNWFLAVPLLDVASVEYSWVRYLISTVWICIRNRSEIIIFRAYEFFRFKWDDDTKWTLFMRLSEPSKMFWKQL